MTTSMIALTSSIILIQVFFDTFSARTRRTLAPSFSQTKTIKLILFLMFELCNFYVGVRGFFGRISLIRMFSKRIFNFCLILISLYIKWYEILVHITDSSIWHLWLIIEIYHLIMFTRLDIDSAGDKFISHMNITFINIIALSIKVHVKHVCKLIVEWLIWHPNITGI